MTHRQELQQQLSRRMQQEARAGGPEFSAGLHERIMDAIREEHVQRQILARNTASKNSLAKAAMWTATAAAALLVLTSAAWFVFGGAISGTSMPTAQNDSVIQPSAAGLAVAPPRSERKPTAATTQHRPSHSDSGPKTDSPLESMPVSEQLALLDDVQIAAGWLTDPLPSVLDNE